RTEVEKTLSEIWRDVLKIERVGVHDNFFELGGHSLLLVRVHQEVVQLTPRPVSIIDLFQYPTIAQLASLLHADVRAEQSRIRTQVDAATRRGEQRRRRHAATHGRTK
ncbi:phosphopantetheine-binding protein, partial [Burkholderia stagnalis]